MKLFATIAAFATAALGVIASPILDLESRAVPAPTGFNITSIGVLGTGCPAGTVYYVLSADRTAVTVTFSNFYASAGPGINIAENRKACQVSLGVTVPGGFTFGIATVDYVRCSHSSPILSHDSKTFAPSFTARLLPTRQQGCVSLLTDIPVQTAHDFFKLVTASQKAIYYFQGQLQQGKQPRRTMVPVDLTDCTI
ncbi:hypothetical protein FRC15_000208 [Serendipita sp. 397]|nr:hypothetical protein FRC15_000208 [Serendipita sp. 397]